MRRQRRTVLRYAVLFVVLMTCYSYFVQGLGPNEMSRYDLVRALVDDHSLTIDRYQENTMDKGYFDGHYYSDKAFALSFMAAPVYATVHAIEARRGGQPLNDFGIVYFLVLFTVALPSALTGVLVAHAARRLIPGGAALFAALAYDLGTIAFPFSTSFFGHQTAAFFGFAATYLLIAARRSGGGPRQSLAAGLLAGLAALVEFPVAIVGIVLFGYILLFLRQRRHLIPYLVGIVPAVLALATYDYFAFGNPFSVSYAFVSDPAFAGSHVGIMGVSWPSLDRAWQLLFAGKGLLVNSPALALAPYGIWRLWREKRTRPEALLCAAVGGSFFLYNAGYWLPLGGMTAGPRFFIPAFPFLALALAASIDRAGGLRVFAWALAVWGMLVMATATMTSPLVTEDRPFPLLDSWIPGLLSGRFVWNLGQWHLGLSGAGSVVPLIVVAAFGLLILWLTADRQAGTAATLRPQSIEPA